MKYVYHCNKIESKKKKQDKTTRVFFMFQCKQNLTNKLEDKTRDCIKEQNL